MWMIRIHIPAVQQNSQEWENTIPSYRVEQYDLES